MPRRTVLSAAERENLLALPDTKDDLIRYYTLGSIPNSEPTPIIRVVGETPC